MCRDGDKGTRAHYSPLSMCSVSFRGCFMDKVFGQSIVYTGDRDSCKLNKLNFSEGSRSPHPASQEVRTIFPRVAGVCLNSVCTVQWAPLRCSLLARTRPCARVIIHPARATRIGGMDVAWSPTSVCCWLWFVQIAAQWMFTWCRQKNKQIM